MPKLTFPAMTLAATLVFSSGTAMAQDDAQKSATAESLFREAKELMAQKQYTEACAKFEASQSLEAGIGTLLNLADCHEKMGRTASAWAEFLRAASLARTAGQADREEIARQRASQLEAGLMRLKITVAETAAVPGLEVVRGGVSLEPAAWGSAIPVDPGTYTVTAKAPGKKDFLAEIELTEQGKTYDLEIPTLEDAPVVEEPPATVPAAPAASTAAAPSEPAPAQPEAGRDPGANQKTWGLVIAGVGAAGLAAGGVLGLVAKADYDDSGCEGGLCPNPDAQTSAEDARDLANVGTIAAAAGGGMLAIGALVYFLAPSSSDPIVDSGELRWSPVVSADTGAVFVSGSF